MIEPTKAYDPRDPAQAIDDPSTWRITTNPVLVVAHLTRTHFGERSIEWTVVAIAADQSDRNGPEPGRSITYH
jgi:hypothetical protein